MLYFENNRICAIFFLHNLVHVNMHVCFSSRCLKVMFFSICVKLCVAMFCVILEKNIVFILLAGEMFLFKIIMNIALLYHS